MNKHKIMMIVLSLGFLGGCSSMRGSLLTGTMSGAALGAGGGALIKRDSNTGKGALTGAAIGAAVGAISSYFIHKGIKSREARIRKETIFNLDKHNVSIPRGFQIQGNHGVSMPIIESEWIDEHVTSDGKKLIEGHKIWHIREDAQWIPTPKRRSKANGR